MTEKAPGETKPAVGFWSPSPLDWTTALNGPIQYADIIGHALTIKIVGAPIPAPDKEA